MRPVIDRRDFLKAALVCAAARLASAAELSTQRFVAYSMSRAYQAIQRADGAGVDFRRTQPSLFYLGGITRPWAVVIDDNEDWILVGERDPRSSILTLDDWVVALRARFKYSVSDDPKNLEQHPGVTINPPSDLQAEAKQSVEFFCGVENTNFGLTCYLADWAMKQIAINHVRVPVATLRTYFDLAVEEARQSRGMSEVLARFWFYPSLNRVNVVDRLVLLEAFQMGVFTEVLSARIDNVEVSNLSDFYFKPAHDFAASFEASYDLIAASREVFETLRGLTRLAGLAAGLKKVPPHPFHSYWLHGYPVQAVATPTEVAVLREASEEAGIQVAGGVRLGAIAMHWPEGGSAAAFRTVVAAADNKELVWEFEANILDGRPIGVSIPDKSTDPRLLQQLWNQALFLYLKRHFEAAITLLDNVIQYAPRSDAAFNMRGAAHDADGNRQGALADFTRALELNPGSAEALFNRGNVLLTLQRPSDAVDDYERALALNPNLVDAYLNRGRAYAALGDPVKELEEYEKAIAIEPRFARAYFARATSHAQRGAYGLALKDLDESLVHDPHLASAYLSKATILEDQGAKREAIDAYERFLSYDQLPAGSPNDWKEYARGRAQELLKELALPPVYERDHGSVPLGERLKRIRGKLALGAA